MIDECLMTEFRVEGDDCPLAAATRETGVAVDAAPPLSRADGTVLLRFSAPPAGALVAALDDDDRVRYLHRAEAGGRHTCRCLSLHPCVVHELVDAGLMAESLRYSDGTLLVRGAVVGNDVLKGVLAAASRTVGATLERAYTMRPAAARTSFRTSWPTTAPRTRRVPPLYRNDSTMRPASTSSWTTQGCSERHRQVWRPPASARWR